MTDNPILTAEQVESVRERLMRAKASADTAIRRIARIDLRNDDVPALCDTVDALRARVAELEQALENAATSLEVTATFWNPGLRDNLRNPYARRMFDTLRCEAAKLRAEAAIANSPKPNNDAGIARLAREYVRQYRQCSDPNHTDAFRDARRALIAAVQKEGKNGRAK